MCTDVCELVCLWFSRPAVRPEDAGRIGKARHHRGDDTMFRRLQTLLETVSTELPTCRHQHRLGGKCFLCIPSGRHVIGQLDGRKPICLDWLPTTNCSVLSFGINNDFTFDDAMGDLGCSVHAFDPTMGVSDHRRSDHVFFHSVGIAGSDGQLHGFPVVSLATAAAAASLGSSDGIDYLKLDVEGSEWDVLLAEDSQSVLQRVTQLALEFHLVNGGRPSLEDGVGLQQSMDNPRVFPHQAGRLLTAIGRLKAAGFVLTDSDHSIACQNYTGGCLAFIYETVWVNSALIAS